MATKKRSEPKAEWLTLAVGLVFGLIGFVVGSFTVLAFGDTAFVDTSTEFGDLNGTGVYAAILIGLFVGIISSLAAYYSLSRKLPTFKHMNHVSLKLSAVGLMITGLVGIGTIFSDMESIGYTEHDISYPGLEIRGVLGLLFISIGFGLFHYAGRKRKF